MSGVTMTRLIHPNEQRLALTRRLPGYRETLMAQANLERMRRSCPAAAAQAQPDGEIHDGLI
jgi:hypothetical protein